MKYDSSLLKTWLLERKKRSLYRTLNVLETPQQVRVKIDGRELLSFSSNDYLGLANHPSVIVAFKKAVDKYGVGSGSSHLVSGHFKEHESLEKELAEFTGRDRAILFSTGYMANLGVINALMEKGDTVFQDRLNHASLIDAGLLCKAKMVRYRHNNMAVLQNKIKPESHKNTMIVSDAVFSMDGDTAPIRELAPIAQEHESWLMVDDAHGFGVLGETGAGLVEAERLSQKEIPLLMATFGKAVGTSGAFVAGSSDVIEYIAQTARTWMYTTAMPPALAAATRESLKVIQKESWRREKLTYLIDLFKKESINNGFELLPSNTAIQPIIIGDSQLALELAEKLLDKGIVVVAIRPPTVPANTARLRITLSASHQEEDIFQLTSVLREVLGAR